MSVAIAIEPQTETYELIRYARDRGDGLSLSQMKKDLGDARAIELEIQYLGEGELKELAAMALIQANRILVALNKPEIVAWPKGWFNVRQSDCDSCGKPGYCKTVSVGVTFPIDCDACHRCRGEEVDEAEYRLTTPLEVAIGLQAYDAEDFFYLDFKSSDLALSIVQQAGLDIWDSRRNQVLTVRQATRLLADEVTGPYEKFGVQLLEESSEFLSHWTQGLFPELVED